MEPSGDPCAEGTSGTKAAANLALIAILRSAQQRPTMYFNRIEPRSVIDWLSGLRTGIALAGLEWSPDDRRPALARLGLEITAGWEDDQLAARGHSPAAIVDELLAIEIARWERVYEQTP
jgi:hypothetical protein